MKRVRRSKPVLQIVHIPRVHSVKKVNGQVNGLTNGHTKNLKPNSRTFENRFEPRYQKMPDMPSDLETPTFSESSNKILKESPFFSIFHIWNSKIFFISFSIFIPPCNFV